MLSGWLFAAILASHPLPPATNSPGPAVAPSSTPVASSDAKQDSPITHFFQNLGHDVEHLASRESGVTMLVGVGAALAAHPADQEVANWARQEQPSQAASVGNAIGLGWVQATAGIGTWAIGVTRHEPIVSSVGSDLLRAQALNAVLTDSLKVVANRTRPSGGSQSFPSGHTSATMATAAVLQSHFGWKVGVVGYAFGGFVGWRPQR